MRDWIIEVQECDDRAKTKRWRGYRHRDGSKNLARFETLGALKRFVKHHALSIGQKVRAFNEVKFEYHEIT